MDSQPRTVPSVRAHEWADVWHRRAYAPNLQEGSGRVTLIFVSEGERANAVVIHLCDPFTGEPMHTHDGDDRNNPARYTTTGGGRLSWNDGTDSQWEHIVRDAVPAGEPVIKQPNGDLTQVD